MSYGLAITNPGGELVISTEGFGLNYIGKASYQGLTANDVSGGNWLAGSVAYRITGCPSAPIPFHTMPLDARVALTDVILVSTGTYDLYYHCDTPSFNTEGYGTQANALEVFVYARRTTVAGSWGMALYDSAGSLAYDLSSMPLFPRQRMAWATVGSAAVAISGGLTKPAYFGRYNADRTFNEFPGGGSVVAYEHQMTYGFTRLTATPGSIASQMIPIARNQFPVDELSAYDVTTDYGGDLLVIDAAGLA